MQEDEKQLTKRERKKLNREKVLESKKESSLKNKLLIVGGIIALAVGMFAFVYKGGSGSPPEPVAVASPSEITERDNVKGPENAQITLLEYGDFQCPACASYSTLIAQITEEFSEDLKLVFRHYPLRSIHRHAQIASQAAEAAARQGKFWEYHDVLFEKQSEWVNTRDPRSLFREYAEGLGLNTSEFENYMNSAEAQAKVDADYDSGTKAGVTQTPTFYINGEKVNETPRSYEAFKQLIQKLIDEKKAQNPEPPESSPEGEITPQL